MTLPRGKIATAAVELSGGSVEVRGLTLDQSRICGDLEGSDRIIAAIVFATGTDKPDVVEWLETAPAGDATKMLDAIMTTSGLAREAAQFPK